MPQALASVFIPSTSLVARAFKTDISWLFFFSLVNAAKPAAIVTGFPLNVPAWYTGPSGES